MELTGKKLLVLGGNMAAYPIVRFAQEMGVYVIVADIYNTGAAYLIADKRVQISTVETEQLAKLVVQEKVDGIYCGPSEFNIQNAIRLCEKTKIPFYTTKEIWDRCCNKASMKGYCKKHGLPFIPEYPVDQNMDFGDDIFPVIVKPIDGNGSRGITVCHCREDLEDALAAATDFSQTDGAIIEKYIDNGGRLFSFRYFLDDGKCYPYLLMDTYVADPIHKKSMISAFSYAPSEYAQLFLDTADQKVRSMLCDMGLKHGTVFAQALPYKGEFYCHDMGYRLSGGMTYRMSEILTGINDIRMMIRYLLGGPICTDEELEKMNPNPEGKVVGQLMIPLNAGTIAQISGIAQIHKEPAVIQFIQNYHVGDTITEANIGSLLQHFGRISMVAANKHELIQIVNRLQDAISIKDTNGNEMFTLRFDTSRME